MIIDNVLDIFYRNYLLYFVIYIMIRLCLVLNWMKYEVYWNGDDVLVIYIYSLYYFWYFVE